MSPLIKYMSINTKTCFSFNRNIRSFTIDETYVLFAIKLSRYNLKRRFISNFDINKFIRNPSVVDDVIMEFIKNNITIIEKLD